MTNATEPMPIVNLLGESAAITTLRAQIADAARTCAKVMITGETGAGKEVVARMIHDGSVRRHRPFVAINCSGIPETLLESELFGHARGSFTGAYRDKPGLVRVADRGTLFLDELGEMSLRMQASLLRFTESGEVRPVGSDQPVGTANVRIITATHRDLRASVAAKEFREDLFYRLNVIVIDVPALRDRGNDVMLLLQHFLRTTSEAHRCPLPILAPETERILRNYRWPGNVRELKNVAERLAVRDKRGVVLPGDLPADIFPDLRSPATATTAALAASQPDASEPATSAAVNPQLDLLWRRLIAGEDFWSVVYQPFRAHDLTRADVRALILRGLTETRGSYRQLVRTFQMPDADYKRFMSFLSQYRCNLPFRPHRTGDYNAADAGRMEVAC